MRVCIVGKYPPIQGGVSMRTYWNAHRLAAQGHEVHVVTNAKEARPPSLMHMRPADWDRCEATCGSGSVTVHWTDPVDRSQTHNPMAAPFVTKLASVAVQVHAEHTLDVIFSHYMEPYGIAGHLAANICGVPHVTRMAGSDAGRLWRHPQFEPLYDHVLQSADIVVAAGAVADRAVCRGVPSSRIAIPGGFMVPEEVFTPDGLVLNIEALKSELAEDNRLRGLMWGRLEPDRPYFGLCGKLSEGKGSFALLAALRRFKRAGVKVGLVTLAHGEPEVERRFRTMADDFEISDSILQLPFIPHWRVPEFLRGCLAVCCLEQNFLIDFHAPIIPREVLLCGTCLVGSTEVIRKLPMHEQLADGYGCVAIEDVNDDEALSRRLAAIAAEPELAAVVGARGCAFARARQRDSLYPSMLQSILEAAGQRQPVPSEAKWRLGGQPGDQRRDDGSPGQSMSEAESAAVQPSRLNGGIRERTVSPEVEIKLPEGAVEHAVVGVGITANEDPLFRLRTEHWAMGTNDLGKLLPVRNSWVRIIEPKPHTPRPSEAHGNTASPSEVATAPIQVAVFDGYTKVQKNTLRIDSVTAAILQLSDGTRTALEIAEAVTTLCVPARVATNLEWIERLFVLGLIGLSDTVSGLRTRDQQLKHAGYSGAQAAQN